ncbi:4Fe-4S dicluster domain-containing protein [Nocardia colli]|uniref:ferredoxin--NADP(+) reductase n=1 Tax=Nocardia colli TaxID=2545717 RepID=A0A5N0EJ67_9NOCA|nr:FAD-dependent oxidoreductase [Nocardia colli]KAA8889438.1 4Fe-4S dicluster domain-containing protein [Nocardia colli]
MPYVVTQSCCNDASCVYACPVNCIHPTPDEPDFQRAEMLYIDPVACMDCGACAEACPTGAIVPHTKLAADERIFVDLNADFYKTQPVRERPAMAPVAIGGTVLPEARRLRVAIVGSGPAALYAADELLAQPGVRVNVFERLDQPHGLAKHGVAPDHRGTRQITGLFDTIAGQSGFEYVLGVTVGRDVTHAELLQHHHAVIYAVGASADRRLGIPGESLPGSASATDFVAWYNGHPEHRDRQYDLSHERAVIVGNGNVALDVARILTTDPAGLAGTDIAPHALAALRESRIREVVVLGRRGIGQAAFTVPELIGLRNHTGADLVVRPNEIPDEPHLDSAAVADEVGDRTKYLLVQSLIDRPQRADRRIELRFKVSPVEITGDNAVSAITIEHNDLTVDTLGQVRAVPTGEHEIIATGMVLRAIGYRGEPVAGLPFYPGLGIIPNETGRVVDPITGRAVPGAYVAGWIKRGPTGFLGTNKSCSQETVAVLLDDLSKSPELPVVQGDRALRALLAQRLPATQKPPRSFGASALARWRRR